MKKYLLLLVVSLILILDVSAQVPISRDSLSGPDLIVLRGGKVIRAKVIDIGLELVKYKNAGYLNGPTYSIYRSQVYAINYPDGKADYFLPADSTTFYSNRVRPASVKMKKADTTRKFNFANNPEASVGIGFFANNTPDGLKQTSLLPSIYLRYTTQRNESLSLGIQLGIARYNYEGDDFSEFDRVVVSRNVSENFFSVSVFGQYVIGTGKFKPYVIGGLSVNTSNIDDERVILSVETNEATRSITGSQNVQLGILARFGVRYQINAKTHAYAGIGTGLSIVQLGAVFNVGN